MKIAFVRQWVFVCILALLLGGAGQYRALSAPGQVVKLVFVHHSTGENWLRDDYGGLGAALAQSNFFVSDTNYGWGPEGIGDRTDIPNWLEWFRGPGSGGILAALYSESGQNSAYTRTLADPGGENTIIMFKSCFPNSALEGSPTDAPSPGGDWLSVSNAKYVYNELLQYFITRPDKLFIVVTAPPLTDGSLSANARGFNQWLVNDWLSENQYTLANVAVFDFYNILTSPENHHWVVNGTIEHVVAQALDTAYYPSAPGDDHPSAEGSRKATTEFLPWLNLVYQRWLDGGGAAAQAAPAQAGAEQAPAAQAPDANTAPVAPLPGGVTLIDDFEGGAPAGTAGWEAFWDEAAPTTITCAAVGAEGKNGSSALRIDFNIAAGSWATCALFFDAPQDWSAAEGIAFDIHSAQAGSVVNFDLYSGAAEARQTYLYSYQTSSSSVETWIPFRLRWVEFQRAAWEENAGAPFAQATQASGLAVGFDGGDGGRAGTIWIDDVGLAFPALDGVTQPLDEGGSEPLPAGEGQPEAEAESQEGGLSIPDALRQVCGAGILIPLAFYFTWGAGKRR